MVLDTCNNVAKFQIIEQLTYQERRGYEEVRKIKQGL